MTNDRYQKLVKELFRPQDETQSLQEAAQACSDVSEELVLAVAANDEEAILDIAGDLMFFLAATINQFGWSFDFAMETSQRKLRSQFPGGVSPGGAE